ncbi:MAG TPA: rhomboid family intramembrane serine protease [Allosphingosinicella sp.]
MRPPENWKNARVTLAIAGVTAAAWTIVTALGWGDYAAVWGGFIPARVGGLAGDQVLAPLFLTPLTAALIQAGFIQLAMNLLIHLFCGRAVEGIVGGGGIAILYLTGAYAAAAGQWLAGPESLVPMIGASGGVSAVLGAYAMLFGRNRVKVGDAKLALWLNALWLAAAWIGFQLLIGLALGTQGLILAIAAQIAGFLAGLLLAKPLLLLRWRGA